MDAAPPARTGALVGLATLGGFGASFLALALEGTFDLESLRLVARFTARFSFACFLLAFAAAPLASLLPARVSRFLVRERRGLDLAFAAAHLVHAGFVLTGILAYAVPVSPVTLLGGSLAYLFVLGLVFTSNERAQRALAGSAWKLVYRLGAGYLFLNFAFAYSKRLDAQPWVAFSGLGALAAASFLHAVALHSRRRGRARALVPVRDE